MRCVTVKGSGRRIGIGTADSHGFHIQLQIRKIGTLFENDRFVKYQGNIEFLPRLTYTSDRGKLPIHKPFCLALRNGISFLIDRISVIDCRIRKLRSLCIFSIYRDLLETNRTDGTVISISLKPHAAILKLLRACPVIRERRKLKAPVIFQVKWLKPSQTVHIRTVSQRIDQSPEHIFVPIQSGKSVHLRYFIRIAFQRIRVFHISFGYHIDGIPIPDRILIILFCPHRDSVSFQSSIIPFSGRIKCMYTASLSYHAGHTVSRCVPGRIGSLFRPLHRTSKNLIPLITKRGTPTVRLQCKIRIQEIMILLQICALTVIVLISRQKCTVRCSHAHGLIHQCDLAVPGRRMIAALICHIKSGHRFIGICRCGLHLHS